MDCLQKSSDLLLAGGNEAAFAKAQSDLGSIYHMQGALDEAKSIYNRALETQEMSCDMQGASMTLANLGLIHQQQGDLDLAQDCLQRSLEAKEELETCREQRAPG